MSEAVRPADHNAAVWRLGAWVSAYDDRRISPAEALLLLRYREPLSGRVLELGPGPDDSRSTWPSLPGS